MLDRRTLPLSSLRAFEMAAKHLHFSKAAESLGVTHGAISHHIKQLEIILNIKLFIRVNHKLTLTPAGNTLYHATKTSFENIIEATRRLDSNQLRGEFIVGCTQTIAASWATKYLCEFQKKYPSITLIIKEISPKQKQIPSDIDVAICYGAPNSSANQIELLTSPLLFPVCSPSLIRGNKVNKLESIFSHTLLYDQQSPWQAWCQAQNILIPPNQKNITFPNTNQALNAACFGYGVALGNTFETKDFINNGQLIQLYNKGIKEEVSYYLYSKFDINDSLKTKLFKEWINAIIHSI